MRHQDHENDTVCPEPPMLETAGDESPSWPSSPFFPVPDELIYHILLRLPVKSLLRFRCVSKSWKTLISDPKFAEEHLRTSIADPNMTNHRLVYSITNDGFKTISCSLQSLLQVPPTPPETLISEIDTKFVVLNFEILGSCNGLLCLFYRSFPRNYVRLFNPSTRCGSQRFPIDSFRMASDITYHGFGYDHVSDKYKLLIVFKFGANAVTNLFTFGANSWTTIQNFPDDRGECKWWLGKFVCGTLNWIAKRHDHQWVIVSLDLGKESFGELFLPEREDDRIIQHVLGVLRGSLCFGYLNSKNQWVVWLMKEYGVQESWTKFRVISRWPYCIVSSCILEKGVMLKTKYSLLFNANDGRLVYLETSSKVGLDLHIYQESFVSPLC